MRASPAPDAEGLYFRHLPALIHLGTASDRYAGWLGQIYSPERFAHRVSRRSKALGSRRFFEDVLPVECVEEYFEHFRVLELDFTFYRPLLDAGGKPTTNFRTLAAYRRHIPSDARVFLKAPQAVFAQKLHRAGRFVANPSYLDSALFTEAFYRPAGEILGPCLAGIVLEQEYQRKEERTTPQALAEALDRFFSEIPADTRYHVELRTEGYLVADVLDVLERHGVGQVLSHWTWLPPLPVQFALGGGRFRNGGHDCVVRLMTPRNVRYEDAYAAAHPFDRLVQGMLDPRMVRDTTRLMAQALAQGERINVIVNNRAGGNAPLIAREIARQFLERASRRLPVTPESDPDEGKFPGFPGD